METIESNSQLSSTQALEARLKIAEIVHKGSASHLGSCYSMVEILRAVFSCVDIESILQQCPDRDRVIVSKGHSAAAVYTVMNQFGLCDDSLCSEYHQDGSIMSGHVNHFVKYIEHSTGALGHGLSVATGISIGLRSKGNTDSKIFAVVGDGELQEGSNWEAMMLAGHLKLKQLCILVDSNGLGGIGRTDTCCRLDPLIDKLESFGFLASEIDGHDEDSIREQIITSIDDPRPSAIICRTIKGKGVSFMENDNVWHYRPPNKEAYTKICNALHGDK